MDRKCDWIVKQRVPAEDFPNTFSRWGIEGGSCLHSLFGRFQKTSVAL